MIRNSAADSPGSRVATNGVGPAVTTITGDSFVGEAGLKGVLLPHAMSVAEKSTAKAKNETEEGIIDLN